MILALDVGNTNIVLGCIDAGNIQFVARVATDRLKTEDEYAISFHDILQLHGASFAKIDGAIISSVVPPLINILKKAVKKVLQLEPMVVGPGIKTGLNILIDNPAQLGGDLAVGAVAAIAEYGKPLIICDMGTASTISVVDANGGMLGGMILPGVRISQEALVSRTSQLPSITLEAPKKVIGHNTIDCMKSGAVFGNAAMLDGIIDRIEEELGYPTTVVATGGLAPSITQHCKHNIICDDHLLLKGLWLIYQKNIDK